MTRDGRLRTLLCLAILIHPLGAAGESGPDPVRPDLDGLLPSAVLEAMIVPGDEGTGPSGSPEPAAHAVTIDDVRASVAAHFPLLVALRAEQEARRGELMAARGGFDMRLGFEGDMRPLGYYESQSADAALEIPTRAWGARFYGGYRIGSGDVPSYEGGRITDQDGELRAGLALPLLRGGFTDPARARIEKADIDLRRMTPEIELELIEIRRAATTAYWDWVAAGRRLEIADRLLQVARERQSQIAGRVERGAEPRIDLTDDQRLIVEREVALRGARRDFEQASIRLSIYLRDDAGQPLRTNANRLPERFPDEARLTPEGIEDDLEHARSAHPILRQLALDRERLSVDLALARNQLLPGLDVRVEGSQDLGASRPGIDETGSLTADSRSSTELKAMLAFEVPLQMREARGRKAAAVARLARLDARIRLARDTVIADALQALEALDAAFDQTLQARENVRLAETLRDAEARRFGSGLSNLIDVNIREVQAATAARQLVDAQASYFRSLADYRARIGRDRD